MASEDMALVQEYARSNSEEVFGTLVSRHINLVYSVALRRVRDPQLAEEITQSVFIVLARKAKSLSLKTILSGWLCRTAKNVSADTLKTERRRQRREQEAQRQSTLNLPEPCVWNQIAPLLDEALASLGQKDHDALVLRFFDGKELKQVGAAMGTSEDAARMRVNRGLEKMRRFFAKKGAALSVTAIAGAVVTNSVHAAPVGLAAGIAAAACSGTAITATTVVAAVEAGAMTTMQKAFAVAIITVVVGAGVYEGRQSVRLHEEVMMLRQQQAAQIGQLQGASDERARGLAGAGGENDRLNRNDRELLRLRGEVGNLQRELQDLRLRKNLRNGQTLQAGAPANQRADPRRTVAKVVVTHTKQPQVVSEEQILSMISVKPGDLFEQEAVDRDVRDLYEAGIFYNIRVATSASGEGTVLNYVVQEKPRISKVRFAGNTKFAGADLEELISSRAEQPLDERKLFSDTERIKELYSKSGVAGAKVKYVSSVNEDVGAGEVTFEIGE